MKQAPRKPGLFSSFTPRPQDTTFEAQEENEEILLLLRRHFVTNLPWLLITLVGLLAPLAVIPFLLSDTFSAIFFIPDSFLLVLTLLYYLVIVGYALAQFATWFYQIGLVTNMRVIDVDFTTLLSRSVAFADIPDVVDVEVVQSGVAQNFFNYGTVHLQTEGIKSNIEFTDIPKPNEVADTVSDLMRELKRPGGEA